jgi:hypothetical protein
MGSHDLEHISTILYRAIGTLAKEWEKQRKENRFEKDDETHFVDAGQIQPLLEPSLDSDQNH